MLSPEVTFDGPSRFHQISECRGRIWSAASRFQIPQQQATQLVRPFGLAGRFNNNVVAVTVDPVGFAVRTIRGRVDAIPHVYRF